MKDCEYVIVKEYGVVFIIGIGDVFCLGEKYDGCVVDYDDWKLNGDILFWYLVL